MKLTRVCVSLVLWQLFSITILSRSHLEVSLFALVCLLSSAVFPFSANVSISDILHLPISLPLPQILCLWVHGLTGLMDAGKRVASSLLQRGS